MSTHPNVILMLCLTPDNVTRKTHRDICTEMGVDNSRDSGGDIKIGSEDYSHIVMESDYDEGFQISAKEGDIVVFNLVTYGYGECILWDKLATQKKELEDWAIGICERYNCKAEILVSANYW